MTTHTSNVSLRFLIITTILIYLLLFNNSIFASSSGLDHLLSRNLGDVIGKKLFLYFDDNFWYLVGLGGVGGMLRANGDLRERVTVVGMGLLSVIIFYELIIKGFVIRQ